MDTKQARKISYIVNTWIIIFVIILMSIFLKCNADYMVYFSFPTILIYLINYFLIYSNKLTFFVRLVYFWLTIYMAIATVCLGYSTGFHLYAFSMISVIFYTEYMSYQLQAKKANAIIISGIVLVVYVISSGCAIFNGSVYDIDKKLALVMFSFNAIIVLGFVATYSLLMIRMTITSEDKLKKMALLDRLTGLYNRYFMIDHLEQYMEVDKKKPWIAMIDMDDFKKVNDQYGHNAGDYVLVHFAEILSSVCKDCVCSRWGGEEYLVLGNESVDKQVLETLRLAVCEKPFVYQGIEIPVSVTIGVADYQENLSMDEFVQIADNKLYTGKNSGKNIVVF